MASARTLLAHSILNRVLDVRTGDRAVPAGVRDRYDASPADVVRSEADARGTGGDA
jgi:hypothetical protein